MHSQAVSKVLPSAEDVFPGHEEGSYVRLIDFVYYSTLGLRMIKKKRRSMLQGVLISGSRF